MDTLEINRLIGKGEYGKIFKAKNKNGRLVAVKNSNRNLQTERDIAKVLQNFNVPKVLGYRELLISEFVNGVTMKTFIQMNNSRKKIRDIASKVIINLKNFNERIPTFRHHDLHLDNIMVLPDGGIKIMDFGLSTMKGVKNPNIKGLKKDYGVFPDSHPMYDAHLFLNSLYMNGLLKSSIGSLLPAEYIGETSKHIKNFRLAGSVKHDEALKNFTYDNILKAIKPKTQNILKNILNSKQPQSKKIPDSPTKSKTPMLDEAEARRKAIAFLASKRSPGKQKKPLKKPGITVKKDKTPDSPVKSITPMINQSSAKRKALAFLASKKSPDKQKKPLKKPGLTKTKPKPLMKGSANKNCVNNKCFSFSRS